MIAPDIATVTSLRAQLWDAGFRPVPVFNADAKVISPGKQPLGKAWQIAARKSPPFCVTSPAVAWALNTGLLCDGLRAIDIDIDDPVIASRCRDLVIQHLGDAPTRFRHGSPRCLLLYRAAVGEPGKVSVIGKLGKVEVLGKGQQFVSFGLHPSGATLEWAPVAPGEETLDDLIPVTENEILAVLTSCAEVIGAEPPKKANGHDHAPGEAQADALRIGAALNEIPNDGPADWEAWNRVGMAVWRATGGSSAGWEAWNAWSARNAAHAPEATRARWNHYATSPPTSIGAGTIFHMAAEAEQRPKPNGADAAPEPPEGGDRASTASPDDPTPAADTATESLHHPGLGRNRRRSTDDPAFVWPAPLDFLADPNSEAPELRHEHIPEAINDFVFDTAARMGVDPTSVALGCIVSTASVVSDDWQVQPKRFDYTWTESARLWGAILGLPSIKKTPVINACTKPIDKLDAAARRRHAEAMRTYQQQMKAAKADKSGEIPEPKHPKLDRYLIESTTIEALSEILREDDDAHQRAPARKVLSRHDEMSEFFANLDRYRVGGNGGGDRGAYLRLYNGGPYTTDRIGRGSFSSPNWSACFLGGMQPGPIQRIAKNTTEDGLLQRFLYVVPGPQARGVDRKPSIPAQERYSALFPALAAMHPHRTQVDGNDTQIEIVVFHANAQRHREAVEQKAEVMAQLPDTSPQLQAAYGKWPGLFARLALAYHLIEVADAHATGTTSPYSLVINEQTARRAAAFMLEIALPHLLRAHRLMFSTAQTGHAQWIAGYILAERLEKITSRDVVRAYGSLRAPEARDELVAVMASLVTIGWLEPEVPTNPAKPVSTWAVNPAVHVRFADRADREQARREKARADLAAYFAALNGKQAETDAA